jgi:hypothetical protein
MSTTSKSFSTKCVYCGDLTHVIDRCPKVRCKKCTKIGHTDRVCTAKSRCEKCGVYGHSLEAECTRCGKHGHVANECTIPSCAACGRLGHVLEMCNALKTCNKCNRTGHDSEGCWKCEKCGKYGHTTDYCRLDECEKCGKVGHASEECWYCSECDVFGHRTEDCFVVMKREKAEQREKQRLALGVEDLAMIFVTKNPAKTSHTFLRDRIDDLIGMLSRDISQVDVFLEVLNDPNVNHHLVHQWTIGSFFDHLVEVLNLGESFTTRFIRVTNKYDEYLTTV